MKSEIDKEFYCSAGAYFGGNCDCFDGYCSDGCKNKHRKHPTPEQYKEEYGEEYPDNGAVYALEEAIIDRNKKEWQVRTYFSAKHCAFENVVCACTPYGKPDDKWRPE